jgi:hypothetical protein
MATQSGINILTGFQVSAYSPIDTRYLDFSNSIPVPYASTSSAINANPYYRHQGLTVLIGTQSNFQEYWWQNGTSDSQLVLKQSLATGNITGSASTGYVALWTGTTSVGYDQSLSFNKGNPNGLLVGSSSYTYLSGSYGLQVSNDTYIGGKIFVNSNLPGNNGISASAISTNGGIYAQNYILGAGGIGIFNGFQNGFFRVNTIQTTAFGTSSITGLSINTLGTYSNLGLTANNIGIVINPQISGSGFFLNTIGVQIIPINNISTYTSNWSSLLIGGTIPSGTWSIYNSDPSSNYFAGNLSIGTSFFYGTYSLQVSGDVHFRSSVTNSFGINIYHASPSNSGAAIYSSTYKSAFVFFNLSGTSYMRGAVSTGPILSIEDTNSTPSSINPLAITSKPPSGDGFTSSFNFLTMAVYPELGTIANGSSLNQQYYYRDYNQLSLGNTASSYRPLGLYGVIFESGTFSSENSSFRWRTMINGSLAESMRLLGNNLLIGYTQSQGTYSLQVNGNEYIQGNAKITGYIQMPSNSVPNTGTSSFQLYAALSSGSNYDVLTYTGRDGKTFNIGNCILINTLNSGTYSLQPYTVISMDSVGRVVPASPDTYKNTLLGITVDNMNPTTGYGRFVSSGLLKNLNLWNYILGAPLYVDYGGGLTSSPPVGYPAQSIGTVAFRGTGPLTNDGALLVNQAGVYTPNWSNLGTDIFNNNIGNVLIGYTQSQTSNRLQVNGNAYFSGSISASGSITAQTGGFDSDFRLKSDIVYNPKIEGIDSIKSASYVIGGNSHIGYIAQDVESIVPSSIIKKDDGYLALNYNEVLVAKVAYLENKVKELYDIIERNGLK